MRFYIGQSLTKRQQWIYIMLQEGKTVKEIHKFSRTGYSLREIEEEVQEVLDITDFCGKAHPNSIVMTTHAYHRFIERYDALLGYEIEAMIDDAMTNGRMVSQEGQTVKITHKDVIWVKRGNKIITVYWNDKELKQKVGRHV